MPTISIRVSDEMKKRLDTFAQETDRTLSSLILEAINSLVGERRMGYLGVSVPSAISDTNRLILRNQELLLSIFSEDNRDVHVKNVEILEKGYMGEYSRLFDSLSPEMPVDMCEELHDILGMFRMLRNSFNKLSDGDKERLKEEDISFRGFDHNDRVESMFATYADFIFDDGGYAELKEPMDRFSDSGNSHSPVLGIYRRMYRSYRQLRRDHSFDFSLLSFEDIEKILSALPYVSGY